MAAETIYRKNYQAPSFSAKTVDLEFELFDEEAIVSNAMKLVRQHPGPLHLYGDELELLDIELDGKKLDNKAYLLQGADLIVKDCPDNCSLKIRTRIRPQENTKLSGLYRSKTLFCTQCEAEGFRRMSFYLDRPDVLAVYSTKIVADKKKYPVLLSNGNLISEGSADNGRHWALWQDPFPKPSYLFALVAGNLEYLQDSFTTASGREVDLRIYVEPGNVDSCSYAMESLKRAMRWDEVEFGLEYDLDIFMIVAVSDFNMGAMENKGLNIFNSKYILARPDTATDQDYMDIESVIGHEYFHNWTGNRVTCRDWFQLSLKEGLTVFRDQEFSRDMVSRDVNRILNVKSLRNRQFPEDAGSMAHPVRPESYQEINNFYTSTIYEKGAEVIRMQQTLLGKEGFRRGMDLYFQRHDGQAVTIDDFVAAMEDANDKDLCQFKRWYSQAGTPELEVLSNYKDGKLSLTMSQSCRPTAECKKKEPYHIPVRIALFDSKGKRMAVPHELLELKDSKAVFEFDHLVERPIVSLLRDFSAPVNLKHNQSQADRLALLRFETDGFSKWNAGQALYIEHILSRYHGETKQTAALEQMLAALSEVLEDEQLDASLRAELILPPGYEDLAGKIQELNVARLEGERDVFRQALGAHLYGQLQEKYNHYTKLADLKPSLRKLKNTCLILMMKSEESLVLDSCLEQFSKAILMTDKLTSFALLANSQDDAIREQAVKSFYAEWKEKDLVLDKWFAIQASCERPGTLARVEHLLSHPAFSYKNPNKVRALIGAFCMMNPRHFHAQDGSGYAFLSQMLLKMDPINPQVAARLATPFTQWQGLDKGRQSLILKELESLSNKKLSADLSELLSKSLDRRSVT